MEKLSPAKVATRTFYSDAFPEGLSIRTDCCSGFGGEDLHSKTKLPKDHSLDYLKAVLLNIHAFLSQTSF